MRSTVLKWTKLKRHGIPEVHAGRGKREEVQWKMPAKKAYMEETMAKVRTHTVLIKDG